MACCVFGAFVTAAFFWVRAFVRQRVLRQRAPADPTTWHLELPPAGTDGLG